MQNLNEKNKMLSNQIEDLNQLDINGFITINKADAQKFSNQDIKKINARMQKWRHMIPQLLEEMKNNPEEKDRKIKKRIRKGIPQAMRQKVWPILAEVEKFKSQNNFQYEDLTQVQEFPYQHDIAVDLPRTFPNHSFFAKEKNLKKSYINNSSKSQEQIQEQTNSDTQKNGNNQDQYFESELQQQLGIIDAKQNSPQISQEQNQKALTQKQREEEEERTMGQLSLNNILKALSISCKDMGYCQGLNFVGASLLIYVNDEEAFWIMFSLMNKYKFLDLYKNLANIHKYMFVFTQLLEKFLGKTHKKMQKLGMDVIFYATPWFMTIFSSVLPYNLFVRFFDIFLYEGQKVLYRAALTMLKYKEEKILQCKTIDHLMELIRDQDYYKQIDEDEFINTMNKEFIFSKNDIEKYEKKYEDTHITQRTKQIMK